MRPVLLLLMLPWLVSCGGAESDLDLTSPVLTSPVEEQDQNSPVVKATVTNTAGDVAADAGFIADGDSIEIPTGFVASQCVFTAGLSSVSGSALSSRVSVNTSTGEVTCKAVTQDGEGVQPTEKGCTASYTVICAK